jgi:hypothetical protein
MLSQDRREAQRTDPTRPCGRAGERGMPQYQILRRLGLGQKKANKALASVLARYRAREEDGQEGKMYIKARTGFANYRHLGCNRVIFCPERGSLGACMLSSQASPALMRPRSACVLRPSSSGGRPASVRVPPAPRCCALDRALRDSGRLLSEPHVQACQAHRLRKTESGEAAYPVNAVLPPLRSASTLSHSCVKKKFDDPVVSSADSLATSSTLRGLPGLQAAAGHAGQAPRGARDAARGRRRGAAAGGARGASRAALWCCRQRPCVPAAHARGQGGLDHRARPGAAGRVRRCGPSLLLLVACITIGTGYMLPYTTVYTLTFPQQPVEAPASIGATAGVAAGAGEASGTAGGPATAAAAAASHPAADRADAAAPQGQAPPGLPGADSSKNCPAKGHI